MKQEVKFTAREYQQVLRVQLVDLMKVQKLLKSTHSSQEQELVDSMLHYPNVVMTSLTKQCHRRFQFLVQYHQESQ